MDNKAARQRVREINMRIAVRKDDIKAHQAEITALRAERDGLKGSASEDGDDQ